HYPPTPHNPPLSLHDALPISTEHRWTRAASPSWHRHRPPWATRPPRQKPTLCSSYRSGSVIRLPTVSTALRSIPNFKPMSPRIRSEEHTSELQSPDHLVCRLL